MISVATTGMGRRKVHVTNTTRRGIVCGLFHLESRHLCRLCRRCWSITLGGGSCALKIAPRFSPDVGREYNTQDIELPIDSSNHVAVLAYPELSHGLVEAGKHPGRRYTRHGVTMANRARAY